MYPLINLLAIPIPDDIISDKHCIDIRSCEVIIIISVLESCITLFNIIIVSLEDQGRGIGIIVIRDANPNPESAGFS